MDTVDPIRFIFASFFVLGLLGLLAVGLKFYGQKSFRKTLLNNKIFGAKLFTLNQEAGRLAIIETQYIDHKSKLLLVKRDDVEHLLLISDGKATIIEAGIKSGMMAKLRAVTGRDE
ncbi:MAG: hypothetical protein ABL857_09315 [Rickettsiales bacterium]|jgi:hypothetical protein